VPPQTDNIPEQIQTLAELEASEDITVDEFEKGKKQLLARL
jgi:hypothetical protein